MTIVEEDEDTGKFKAKCHHCQKVYSGSHNARNNLLSHLTNKHKEALDVFRAEAAAKDAASATQAKRTKPSVMISLPRHGAPATQGVLLKIKI